MKLMLKLENGYEENMLAETPFIWKIFFLAALEIFLIFFMSFLFIQANIILSGLILWNFLLFDAFDEKITLDKGLKRVVVEKRTITDKRLKWKEIRKISFSDIKEVRVTELYSFEGSSMSIDLITNVGDKKIFTCSIEEAKELGVSVAKMIGVNLIFLHETI